MNIDINARSAVGMSLGIETMSRIVLYGYNDAINLIAKSISNRESNEYMRMSNLIFNKVTREICD